jgi:ssDNA-binding Zn-finger/Zn-ribbon topoisomerase 1
MDTPSPPPPVRQCPRCLSPMQIRNGYLGEFWGCVTFPICKGTVTAKGTYMRKFTPTKSKKPKES